MRLKVRLPREPFDVTRYSDAELVVAWYWFHWYKGIGHKKFYADMEQKCIAERASRMINQNPKLYGDRGNASD